MTLVEVERASCIFHGRVFPLLDAQTELLKGQVAQGSGLGLGPRQGGFHEGGKLGRIPNHLDRVTEQQRLQFGLWRQPFRIIGR